MEYHHVLPCFSCQIMELHGLRGYHLPILTAEELDLQESLLALLERRSEASPAGRAGDATKIIRNRQEIYHVISFDWGKMMINIDQPCWDTFLETNSNRNIRKTRHGHLLDFPCAKPAFWTRNCILDPNVMVMHPTHQRSIASSSSPSRWRIHEILIHPDFPPSLSSKGADGAPSTQHSWSSQVRFLKNFGKRLSTWQQKSILRKTVMNADSKSRLSLSKDLWGASFKSSFWNMFAPTRTFLAVVKIHCIR